MAVTSVQVQNAISLWKGVNLTELQKELDETATDLANRQDESEISRKKLVELSRDFKKTTPEDVRKQVAPLMKNFQLEVDSLSKRSKSAEAAFLNLYKKLIELPDPSSVLETAGQWQKKSQKTHELELEVKNLQDTIEQYNAEFTEVKNQEVTIRQLREKLRQYDEQMESLVERRVKETEVSLKTQFDLREGDLIEGSSILQSKLSDSEKQVNSLNKSLNEAQRELFDLRNRLEERHTARNSEEEMLLDDLDRAQQRADTAERELEMVRVELETLKQTDKSIGVNSESHSSDNDNSEIELAAKDRQLNQLMSQVQQLQAKLTRSENEADREIDQLKSEINEKSLCLVELQARVESFADYDEIKRELNTMKSIEFGSSDSARFLPIDKKPLEVLLLEKNKALQSTNTELKVTKQEIEDVTEDETESLSTGHCKPSVSGRSSEMDLISQQLQSEFCGIADANDDSSDEFNNMSYTYTAGISINDQRNANDDGPRATLIPEVAQTLGLSSDDADQLVLENLLRRVHDQAKQLTGTVMIDTMEIAQRCRSLLNQLNIGQRVFSRFVLLQSQGALSELLSKPKHWDRLTEKGRDTFRKMYAWAHDEELIEALKTLAPKKLLLVRNELHLGRGRSNGSLVNSTSSPLNSMVDADVDDVDHGFYAGELMQPEPMTMPNGVDAEPSVVFEEGVNVEEPQMESTPEMHNSDVESIQSSVGASDQASTDNQQNCNLRYGQRYRHDDIPKEMIIEIYEREKIKLEMEECMLQSGHVTVDSQHRHGHATRSTCLVKKEIKAPVKPTKCVYVSRKRNSSAVASDTHPPPLQSSVKKFDSVRNKLLAEMPNLKRKTQPERKFSSSTMKSQNHGTRSRSQGPRKAGLPLVDGHDMRVNLPPITEAQFERSFVLETETVVGLIKSFLDQHCISQRFFGHNVLGLSQGSVSDLLARPKHWYQLTHKGKEPFIRMQMFLDSSDAIDRLLSLKSLSSASTNSLNNIIASSNSEEQLPVQPSSIDFDGMDTASELMSNFDATTEILPSCSNDGLLNPVDVYHRRSAPCLQNAGQCALSTSLSDDNSELGWWTLTNRRLVSDMASRTQNLNTVDMCERVKRELIDNNINQKQFGDAVLGLSQGSVSELLSKPRPWSVLGAKGREPYVRMHLWLNDPDRIDKTLAHSLNKLIPCDSSTAPVLQSTKSNKQAPSFVSDPVFANIDSNPPFEEHDLLGSSFASSSSKKARVVLEPYQKKMLKRNYEQQPYPSNQTIHDLATELGLSQRTVINWFHNHRMRIKYSQADGSGNYGVISDDGLVTSNHDAIVSSTSDNWSDVGEWEFDADRFNQGRGDQSHGGMQSVSKYEQDDHLQGFYEIVPPPGVITVQPTDPMDDEMGTSSGVYIHQSTLVSKSMSSQPKNGTGGGRHKLKPRRIMSADDQCQPVDARDSIMERMQRNLNSIDPNWDNQFREETVERLERNVAPKQSLEEQWEF